MNRVMVAKGMRRLVPSELESKLLGAGIYTKRVGGWSVAARTNGLVFDLSRVEYADFGAVVQLLLLIEAALRDGLDVAVATPLPHLRNNEKVWRDANPHFEQSLTNRVERRQRCLAFLQYLRFEEALTAAHFAEFTGKLQVIGDFDSGRQANDELDDGALPAESALAEALPDESEDHDPATYRYWLPLTWMSTRTGMEWDSIRRFLIGVIGVQERGLEGPDADAIANVLMFELVENVAKHSERTSWALVGAWARPERWPPRADNFLDVEKSYLDWFLNHRSPLVELVVGDSGVGIPESLCKSFLDHKDPINGKSRHSSADAAEIMLWSLDRWSTRLGFGTQRGTRGLYRVDRVVTKYQGIITIRSERHLVARDHGGPSYDRDLISRQRLSRIPGTILRLRLPAMRMSYSRRESPQTLSPLPAYQIVRLGSIQQTGLSLSALDNLATVLRDTAQYDNSCVLAVVDDGEVDSKLLESVLRKFADLRHPTALVVFGLPGGWSLIENAVESVNADHERERRDDERVTQKDWSMWDPVLVVGMRGEIAWVGTNSATRAVLERMDRNGPLALSDIEGFGFDQKTLSTLERQLRGDTSLFTYDANDSFSLRLDPGQVPREVERILRTHIDSSGAGVTRTGHVIRTPSLRLVDCWLNIEQILASTCGARLAISALYMRLISTVSWDQEERPNAVGTDSVRSLTNVALLEECLRINSDGKEFIPEETSASFPPGIRIFGEGNSVLIYSDIISSGESVGRSVRKALRDGAKVLGIACIVDARGDPESGIEVWGIQIPVVSLLRVGRIGTTGTAKNRISPVTYRLESEPTRDRSSGLDYKIEEGQFNEILKRNNALYFSHIGRPIGRHFTFYLDASRLVDEPIVQDAIQHALDSWLDSSSQRMREDFGDGFEVWYVDPETSGTAVARIVGHIKHRYGAAVKRPRPISRRAVYGQWEFGDQDVECPTVVIVDWGAISGTTIIHLLRLAAEHGARRVLACIFVSQLSRGEERFLTMLKTLRGSARPPFETSGQGQLFHDTSMAVEPQPNALPSASDVDVTVEFLARFPINAYTAGAADCPICQQLGRLSTEVYPTDTLSNFASRQEKRLAERTLESVLITPPTDFYGRKNDPEALLWMLSFRKNIVAAMGSTYARERLQQQLSDLRSPTVENAALNPRRCLWLLQFFEVESHWLRKPPLNLWVLRQEIAEIACDVALGPSTPEFDRINAIVVLRTTSKPLFAHKLAEVFDRSNGQDLAQQHLLYDAFTYVTRPYHQSPKVLEPICSSLAKIAKSCGGASRLEAAIANTVLRLYARAQSELAKANRSGSRMSEAWGRLQLLFGPQYRIHGVVPQCMLRVRPSQIEKGPVEKLLAQSAPGTPVELPESVSNWLSGLLENWTVCEEFLDNQVLPDLVHLKNALLGDDGLRVLGRDTVGLLIGFIDRSTQNHVPIAEGDFAKRVREISQIPRSMPRLDAWEKFCNDAQWFWDKLFRLPNEETSDPGSPLIKFLDSTPSKLFATFSKIYSEAEQTLPRHSLQYVDPVGGDFDVFCPRQLLRDAFREWFGNIVGHVDASQLTTIRVGGRRSGKRIAFFMSNDNCIQKQHHGVGLNRLRNRLEPFDVDLQISELPRGAMQFEISLTFDEVE